MIPENKLVGAAMQQPFLMGEKQLNNSITILIIKIIEKNLQLNFSYLKR